MSTGTAVSLVYLFDALVALAAAAVVWRRRDAGGARSLSTMLGAVSVWAICDAAELHVTTVELKQFVSQIQYIGVVAVAPAYFEAALALAGVRRRLTLRMRVLVWSVPVLSLAVAWTNGWHHWLWTGIVLPAGDSPFATYEYGWWFWVLTAQTYALMAASSALLMSALRGVSRGFRTAMVVVLVATILPWIGNAAYNLKLGPWPGLDWLTLSIGLSGWLLVWVVARGGLLDLLPQARGALIEMMTDAVLVLDRAGRITDSNRVAREMLGSDATALLDRLATPSPGHAPMDGQRQVEAELPQGRRWLDVRVGPVFDRWQALAGRIVVVRDVTTQKALERERERLIEELRDALRRVTQLEGLLHVCAGCHGVLNNEGGWTSIEKYIASHTPVEFSHAICPDCMARLYPELADMPGTACSPHNEAWRPR